MDENSTIREQTNPDELPAEPDRISKIKELIAQLEELGKEELKEQLAVLKQKVAELEGIAQIEESKLREKWKIWSDRFSAQYGFSLWIAAVAVAIVLIILLKLIF